MSEPPAAACDVVDIVDLAFALHGTALPREHRRALADALQPALPCWDSEPGLAVHRVNVAAGVGPRALLSGRTRLTLRLSRVCAQQAAAALEGRTLVIGGLPLRIGMAHPRELLPHGTLYSHLVTSASADELQFLRDVQDQLAALQVEGRAICGRHQLTEEGTLQGFGLMVDGLSPLHSMCLQRHGLGLRRRLGCGVFVPHKSAAAVGTRG